MKQITTFYPPNKLWVLLTTVLLLAISVTEGMAQRTISGTVQDNNNDPFPGVSVIIVGTTIGTVTDVAGRYSINVPEISQRLSFSFIGFETQITEVNSRSIINIVMAEDSQNLSEVVVTAFGIHRSISQIRGFDHHPRQ